jgi:hypothetical protein
MIRAVVSQAKYQWRVKAMEDSIAYQLLAMFQEKVKEWCKETGKKYNTWHQQTTSEWFFKELKRVWGWEPANLILTA